MTYWQNKRVAVTGGHGFLGKHLITELEEQGCASIFAPTKKDYDLMFPGMTSYMLQDAGEIDVLFHLAANVGGIQYNQKKPYSLFLENALMGVSLIHLSLYKVKKFVQIGTACSYPDSLQGSFQETDLWKGYPHLSNAPYGIAKKILLTQLQAARIQYGFNGIYVIPANLYGPGDNYNEAKSHVIPALIKKFVDAKENRLPQVEVWGNGTSGRDFLYVTDAVRGILLAAEKYNEPEPINLGSGESVLIWSLVSLLKQLAGYQGEIVWDASKPNGQISRQLDVAKANTLLWESETSLEDGLKETIKDYIANAKD